MTIRELGFAAPVFVAMLIGTLSVASLADLPGLSYDSLRYLSGAESILESGRYRIFGSENMHWPPGTSLLIAYTSSILGIDLKTATIIDNFACYVIAGCCLYAMARTSGINNAISSLVISTILINSSFVSLYGKLWSEPIFLSFLYGSIVFVIIYIRLKAHYLIVISSLLLGCAIVVRYAGFGFIPILLIAPWLITKRSMKNIWTNCGSIALIILPSIIVLVNLHINLLSAPPGTINFDEILVSGLLDGLRKLSEQILPEKLFGHFSLLIFLMMFLGVPLLCLGGHVILAIYHRKAETINRGDSNPQIYNSMTILFLAIGCYISFLIISKSLVDSGIPLDSFRILSPIFPLILIVGAAGAEFVSVAAKTRGSPGTTRVAGLLMLVVGFLLSISAIRSIKFAVLERFT